ncbi:nickel-dependent lactate racemase [Planctomycetota bacterium]
MKIQIPYGKAELTHTFRKEGIHLDKAGAPKIPPINLQEELLQGFHNPIGGEPLSSILEKAEDVVVVFSDRTRKYPVKEIIDELVREFVKAGISDQRVTLVCGGGAHAGNTLEHCCSIAGKEYVARFKTVIHDARDMDICMHAGTTSYGTEVFINRTVAEASCIICTGVIVPHYYAGFSGGRKAILPGTAAEETIVQNHSLNFYDTKKGRNWNAVTCNLENNPVHMDMVEGARMCSPDFIVNVTMDFDGYTPTGVFCGDMEKAHEKGCAFYLEHYKQSLSATYDMVIAGAGGYPKDGSLYQAHKAVDNVFKALSPDGVLIMAAECREGLGKEDFLKWLKADDLDAVEKKLRESYCIEGHTAYCFRRKSGSACIHLVSELDPDTVRQIGCIPFQTIEEAVDAGLSLLQKNGITDPSILFVPEGDQFVI